MKRHRKTHSGAFKAKVALEAVKGTRTMNEVAGQFEIHPTQVLQWKQRLVAGAPDLFNGAESPGRRGGGRVAGPALPANRPDEGGVGLVKKKA